MQKLVPYFAVSLSSKLPKTLMLPQLLAQISKPLNYFTLDDDAQ